MRLRNDPALLAAGFRWPWLAHEVDSNEKQSAQGEQASASVERTVSGSLLELRGPTSVSSAASVAIDWPLLESVG